MALTGIEIYKRLPKTNCKECGFPTCLAFAMQLAAKKISLDKCPYISEEAKKILEGASQPPVRLVSIGRGGNKIELGNETVLFRHEEKFYHPTAVGFLVSDDTDDAVFKKKIGEINKLRFERIGKEIRVDLIALKCVTGDTKKYCERLKYILSNSELNLVLISGNPDILKDAAALSKDRRPLLCCAGISNLDGVVKLAKEYGLPAVVASDNLDDLAGLSGKVTSLGVPDIILDSGKKDILDKISDLTYIRRMALKKNFRPFGFPSIAFTTSKDPFLEAAEAVTYISKYASIVIMNNTHAWEVLPVLTARSDLYTDPQKPVQVEPKIYTIGQAKNNSPVLITTNFSITYYTVQGEVEASKVPSFLVSIDTEGMSVLTAWAAEKFTPDRITAILKSDELKSRVSHKKVIIPGYVAVMSGKLEEESGWEVIVGPKEAAGIPQFLRTLPA